LPLCALNGFNECGPINFFAQFFAFFLLQLAASSAVVAIINNNWASRRRPSPFVVI